MAVSVVKVGGAAITFKDKEEHINHTALQHVAHSIAQSIAKEALLLVLVHGAGSFGHHAARRYNLTQGGSEYSREGFQITRQSVLKLHQAVLQALQQVGVKAHSVSPHPHWITAKGGKEVVQDNMETIRELLQQGRPLIGENLQLIRSCRIYTRKEWQFSLI